MRWLGIVVLVVLMGFDAFYSARAVRHGMVEGNSLVGGMVLESWFIPFKMAVGMWVGWWSRSSRWLWLLVAIMLGVSVWNVVVSWGV